MIRSLKGRLAFYFALAITISIIISGLLAVSLVQRYLKQKTISDLEFQAEALARQVEAEGLPQRRYVNDLERVFGIRTTIVLQQDQALEQLPRPGADTATPGSRQQLQFLDWQLLGRGETQVKETSLPGMESEVVAVAHGFNAGGQPAGAVVMTKPLRQLQSWQPLAGWFFVAAIPSLAISLLIALLLARRLSRPLHEITGAASALAAGDFSRELSVRRDDEIGALAEAFRHMAAEVKRSQEQRRDFIINISHELRTPLTAIAGHAQALLDGVAAEPAQIERSVRVIDEETRRLSRLIDDLISLAKFDAHQFELRREKVAPDELVQAVADSFARQAEEGGISLVTAVPAAGTLMADPDRLRQILANLVGNALAHTPAGGEVSISARLVGAAVEFEVADTGRGIDAADLPFVFDRFYRVAGGAKEAGLGLGLAISRELALAMGGDISVASRPGEGTRFTVTLPGAEFRDTNSTNSGTPY